MTLMCGEHSARGRHSFRFDAQVFRCSLVGGDAGVAICKLVVEAIPRELREMQPVAGGIVIHYAHSSPTIFPESDLSWSEFRGDDFFFSIDLETAGRYLPNITGMLLRADPT